MQNTMNLPRLASYRKELRNHLTPAEAALWKFLKGRQFEGFKFRRQHSVGPYILDFYCPQLKLAIELDGESHFCKEEYDEQRTYFLSKVKGITVLRFENRMVFEDMERIMEEIVSTYHLPPSGYSSSREEESFDSTVCKPNGFTCNRDTSKDERIDNK